MGIFNSVLLLSDFDGTLTGSDGKIPQRNIDSIKYFINEGGLFSVSTGRTKAGFHNFSEEFINAPVILANGAMAYDYKKDCVTFLNPIEKEVNRLLKEISNHKPYASIEIYSADHKTYVYNINEASQKHFDGLKISDYTVIEAFEQISFPVVKIMLSVGENTFDMQDFLRATELKNIKFIPCTGPMVDILAESAGKGYALLQLARHFGIKSTDAYAVGDGSNDVDMLNAAAIGFSPENSDDLALKACDVKVCSSDKGSIADAIEYLRNIYTKI